MRQRLRASLVLCSLLVGGTLVDAARPYQQAAVSAPAAATLANAADQEFTADGVTLRYRDVGRATRSYSFTATPRRSRA